MIALVFDTETTGFAKFKKPLLDPTQPRLVQLGAIYGEVFYEEGTADQAPVYGNILGRIDCIICPELGTVSWTIPEKVVEVHGISTEFAQKHGVYMDGPILHLAELVENADVVVAHNAVFDTFVIQVAAAMLKKEEPVVSATLSAEAFFPTPTFCTLIGAKQLPEISYKGTKGPNLQSLHEQLIGHGFTGAHSAYADTEALWRVFCVMNHRLEEMNGAQV